MIETESWLIAQFNRMLEERKTNFHEPHANSRYQISAAHWCSKEIAHSVSSSASGPPSAAAGDLQVRIEVERGHRIHFVCRLARRRGCACGTAVETIID